MGFKEALHPVSVRQAEITVTISSSRAPGLGDASCFPHPRRPLYAVSATYKPDTQAWDTENATSDNVSGSRPSPFSFNEMHPGRQETPRCRGGRIVAGQPSVLPAPPERISQCPTSLSLSLPRGQPSHPPPSFFQAHQRLRQELLLQSRSLFCRGAGRGQHLVILGYNRKRSEAGLYAKCD